MSRCIQSAASRLQSGPNSTTKRRHGQQRTPLRQPTLWPKNDRAPNLVERQRKNENNKGGFRDDVESGNLPLRGTYYREERQGDRVGQNTRMVAAQHSSSSGSGHFARLVCPLDSCHGDACTRVIREFLPLLEHWTSAAREGVGGRRCYEDDASAEGNFPHASTEWISLRVLTELCFDTDPTGWPSIFNGLVWPLIFGHVSAMDGIVLERSGFERMVVS